MFLWVAMAWAVICLYELIRHTSDEPMEIAPRVTYKPPLAFQEVYENDTTCSRTRRPSMVIPRLYDVWYVTNYTNVMSYTYVAYYDDRTSGGPKPFIRFLAVAIKIEVPLYCQVWYNGWDKPVVVDLAVKANGGGHRIGKQKYEQLYYSCPLESTDSIPTHVSIVEQRCETADNLIPVIKPYHGSPIHEFGICVAIAFETVDPYRIVEWVEANRLLGVTEINVYHVNMNPISLKVLEHYQEEGILKLFHVPSAPYYVHNRDGNKIASPITLNDCMYKNMYRYRWAIVVDIDELIVPTTTPNYPTMIQKINEHHKLKEDFMSYTFRNAYFWTDCGNEKVKSDVDKHSFIMRLKRREPPSKEMFAPKSIIDPRKCLSVFNHYCYIRFPDNKGKKFTQKVDPSLALSHHYRVPKGNCKNVESTLEVDNSVDIIVPDLKERYHNKIKLLEL